MKTWPTPTCPFDRRERFLAALVFVATLLWTASAPAQLSTTEIGIDEHLGATIPLDATFYDETGQVVRLGDLIDRPTALALVYYSCPGICSPLLDGVAEVIGRSQMSPGVDYRVIAISFDVNDTPAAASEEEEIGRRLDTQFNKRKNYMAQVGRDFPEAGWRFLTGDQENIDRITSAVGFKYKLDRGQFVHSAALTILSPEGKITRYLYGVTYLPFDLEMAVVEASQGKVGPTVNKLLRYCFAYDPDGRTYALSVTRISGVMTLFFVAFVLFYVLVAGRPGRRGGSPAPKEEAR
ncbi:SCO family protein [bacterium]|nr:SCO family protein [bacterium]